MGPPGPPAPSPRQLCRSQALHSHVFPHFSTSVHSLSHSFQLCWDTVEFPEHSYSWLISQLKDKSCSRGDSEMPWGVHGGSEPASCGCWRCPGHSTRSRQPHVPNATTLTEMGQCLRGLITPPMPPAPSELTQPPSGAEAPPALVVRSTKPRARYCDSFPFFLNLPTVQNCSFCLNRHL